MIHSLLPKFSMYRSIQPLYKQTTMTYTHTHTHAHARTHARTHTHTHTRLTALFPGLPGYTSTRKVKPMWILLKQETVSGSGISWDICKSATRSRQKTMPAPHHSVFYRPDALPATQPMASKHWSIMVCTRCHHNDIHTRFLTKSATNVSQQEWLQILCIQSTYWRVNSAPSKSLHLTL